MDVERFLPLTPVVLEIAMALAAGERHGYDIMQDVERRTDGRIVLHPGHALSRALARLLDQALIEELDERRDDDDERRRYYRLTAAQAGRGAGRSRAAGQPESAPRGGVLPRRTRVTLAGRLPRAAARVSAGIPASVSAPRWNRRSAIGYRAARARRGAVAALAVRTIADVLANAVAASVVTERSRR